MKQIQIPADFWADLLRLWVYYDMEDYDKIHKLLPRIKSHVEYKLDAQIRRKLYTQYKMGATEEEREKARQEYLDSIGMRESFRWPSDFLEKQAKGE